MPLGVEGETRPARWGSVGLRTAKPIAPSVLASLANSTLPGSRIGRLKATSTVNAPGRRGSSWASAAGLGPHPVGDLAREAERLRGQPVQVDRVAVARDAARSGGRGRRAASTRPRSRRSADVGALGSASSRAGGLVAPATAPQVRALADSQTSSSPTRASVSERERRALRMRLELRRAHAAARAPRRARSAGAA